MFSNDKKFRTEIEELDLKEKDCKKRVQENINQIGESLGVELSKKNIELIMTTMNLNNLHIEYNREKNIKLLQRGFTMKVRYLLYKGKIINWVKNLFGMENNTSGESNNGITKCV